MVCNMLEMNFEAGIARIYKMIDRMRELGEKPKGWVKELFINLDIAY